MRNSWHQVDAPLPHASLCSWRRPWAAPSVHRAFPFREAKIESIDSLLERLQANAAIEEAAPGGSLLHRHLRCHYAVLFVSMALVAGRITDLQAGGWGRAKLGGVWG